MMHHLPEVIAQRHAEDIERAARQRRAREALPRKERESVRDWVRGLLITLEIRFRNPELWEHLTSKMPDEDFIEVLPPEEEAEAARSR